MEGGREWRREEGVRERQQHGAKRHLEVPFLSPAPVYFSVEVRASNGISGSRTTTSTPGGAHVRTLTGPKPVSATHPRPDTTTSKHAVLHESPSPVDIVGTSPPISPSLSSEKGGDSILPTCFSLANVRDTRVSLWRGRATVHTLARPHARTQWDDTAGWGMRGSTGIRRPWQPCRRAPIPGDTARSGCKEDT